MMEQMWLNVWPIEEPAIAGGSMMQLASAGMGGSRMMGSRMAGSRIAGSRMAGSRVAGGSRMAASNALPMKLPGQ